MNLRSFILLYALFITTLASAQLPKAIIDINGGVYGEIDGKKVGVARILLVFSPSDTVRTDASGNYEIRLPDFGMPIKVAILPSDYDIVVPPKGEIHFENLQPSKLSITCNIMVMGDQINEELMQQINSLNKNIRELQKKNNLSERKVLALQNTMMDTLLYYQQIQASLENKLDLQNKEILQLRDSIKIIFKKYYEALDEKFLRQQEDFTSVSEKLNTYISRAADLRDWMPKIKLCFERGDAAQNYSRLIKDYNQVRDKINAEHEKDISSVNHYWTNPETAKQLQETYNYLLNEVHDNTFLLWIGKINEYFAAVPAKPNQAQKVADAAQVLMKQKVAELEKQSEIIIELMRDQI
ncbi:MAG: hypothetical protein OEV74_20730 [Cyclobacteriaceae bacterium]|nr:hypothetical protein [Cyclobacteriaceae bacterium]MDH4298710.1 hypothetical protein [Cyclobacteriaceae bacterium]MDH5251026.1 hypothetical protein [Cyclobacteriaceae bacterium]